MQIILNGCLGSMGRCIVREIESDGELSIAAGIDRNCGICVEEYSFPMFERIEDCRISGDVVMDFSHYGAADQLLEYCRKEAIPAVIATTGLSESQIEQMGEAALRSPIFYSPNMSFGIHMIKKCLEQLAKNLETNFNVEIVEKHHLKKKDAPSGTALALAETINNSCLNKKEYVYGRQGRDEIATIGQMGIHSVRGGTIVGEHQVIFAGEDEVIEIKHSALSKEIFARGAIRAARFIVEQKNGLFGMDDLTV